MRSRHSKHAFWAVLGLLVGFSGSALGAREIHFLEDFALAADRGAVLEQLIPGTEEYYYYHCLHAQNEGRLDRVDELLEQWIKRHKRTALARQIENRQALLRYSDDPARTLAFLRDRLNLRFDHQRNIPGAPSTLPTALDPALIDRDTLTRRALESDRDTVGGFEDRALEWVAALDLDEKRRRHLLSRLARPDVPGLARLVVADLAARQSRGFGSHRIHSLLLTEQLDECLRLKPDLIGDSNFVATYIARLWPNPDVDWEHDPASREAYLDRLQAFVARLPAAHNSLKAHVLYHRLAHDHARGVHDRGRFVEYLALPRNASYVEPRYMAPVDRRRHAANLGTDFRGVTLLPPVGDDEPLVRAYLAHFLLAEESWRAFAEWVRDDYLKRCFAETKILAGVGDMERWYSLLSPSEYQRLKERVDIDFDATSKTVFRPAEQVGLDVHLKNVGTLIVRVFEINTLSYYLSRGQEIDTAVDLDGLVAGEEKIYTYDDPPLRRVKRRFEFADLKPYGTYVVEFIGNGMSSRALVRRGRLGFLERRGAAGHVLTVLDESRNHVRDATVWLGSQRYSVDEDGTITIPYSTSPGRRAVVIERDGFASLDWLDHDAERYELRAGFHCERESLVPGATAKLLVRPELQIGGTPASLGLLEDVTLTLTTTDLDGVSTSRDIRDFKLFEDRESVQDFSVPQRVAALVVRLTAKVRNVSRGADEHLAVGHRFDLNRIDATEKIEDIFLGRIDGAWSIDVLGKTGEVRAGRPVHLSLKHRDFTRSVDVTLQSDPDGRIALGTLAGIDSIAATLPGSQTRHWTLGGDESSLPVELHGVAGKPLVVPYSGAAARPLRSELSLLEQNGAAFLRDRFDALALDSGLLRLEGLEPGDYDLYLKDAGRRIAVRVTAGQEALGWAMSSHRQLEQENTAPLQVAAVELDGDTLVVRLANSTTFARVHVAATRYLPEYGVFDDLNVVQPRPLARIQTTPPEALYVVGRDIGDEYRYVLERKQARVFPGNMLERPAMLLNPWAIRDTSTGVQVARGGEEFARRLAESTRGLERGGVSEDEQDVDSRGGYSSFDFLGAASPVLVNLDPDDDGVVRVPRALLGSGQHIHVLAVDPRNSAYRQVSVKEVDADFADLRLRNGLDHERHFAQKKQGTIVQKGGRFVIDDIATAEFEVYDTLAEVHQLLATLSGDATLAQFAFVLEWPTLSAAKKGELYSAWACHELNFFIFKKDPAFFAEVVRPYLENKLHKTFLDHWLLGHDVSAFLEPWNYARLNVVERILLAQRVAGEGSPTRRHVEDLFDLLPPDLDRFEHLFKTALGGRALAGADDFGVDAAKKELADRFEGATNEALGRVASRARRPQAPAGAAPPAAAAEPEALALADAAPREKLMEQELARDFDGAAAGLNAEAFYSQTDLKRRQEIRQLFRELEPTKEWAENNYWHLPIEQQIADLVSVNAFWRDFARHDGDGPFFSPHFTEASRNFAEMMFALSVLDLPFEAGEHASEIAEAKLTLDASSPFVVFHEEIRPAEIKSGEGHILVSQNFYPHGARYIEAGNERLDNYVDGEFVVHTVYGCHVVVTNPTSSRQKLSILLQVPRGSLPVLGGHATRSIDMVLEPYRTWTHDFFFYFPAAGNYPQFPVHVARDEAIVAFAPPATLNVVDEPSRVDTRSWEYVSQRGTPAQVMAFLESQNLGRVALDRIAWRMRDKDLFTSVTDVLRRRHVYDGTLWSYALLHDVPPVSREFLRHADGFIASCGAALESPLLVIDPVERRSYQHLEYSPLVNARAHRLGKRREIVNDRAWEQYMAFLRVLSCRGALDDEDLVGVTYYLALQDRVEEALPFYERIRPQRLASRLQYDYLTAYTSLSTENLRRAREMATRYVSHPVDRWRNRFAAVTSQLDEIEGRGDPQLVDPESRDQSQTKLADTEAGIEFEIEGHAVTLQHRNLESCRVNYYVMDLELLFSRNPFVQQTGGSFTFVRPNATVDVPLTGRVGTTRFELPERLRQANLIVEVIGGGARVARPYYANTLALELSESYAQLRVAEKDGGKALSKAYVKVYARHHDGSVRFYKDGYTDLRGRFDYGSLSTPDVQTVQRFSILVMSAEHGAMVREATPPQM